MFGEKARWGDGEYLLAQAVDYLQAAIIQQSGKGKGRFKPVPRPGSTQRKAYGNRTYTVEQLRRKRAQRARKDVGDGG